MNDQQSLRVLLLEDDPDDEFLISNQLHGLSQNFEIEWVDTLRDAIDLLKKDTFDIVLADLTLPDSHGLPTVSRLRQNCGETPIIVVTSLEDECIESDILAAGAQDYLVKGEFCDRAVFKAISHAVQRQHSVNEVNALVTELAQSQELLQEQARMLRQKNRRLRKLYKTAQEFVDNVSHDFRTPLTVIKDYVAIIREGLVGDINDEQRSMLDKVSVRADDLNNMVDDLLDVSKLESGLLGAWRRSVKLDQIFEHSQSLLQQRAQIKNVDFQIECAPNIPEVFCDADKVGRVIMNLAVNAIKFSGDGGRVSIWTRPEPESQQVVVGISDNGPGIDPSSLKKIFERFRQIDNEIKATVKGFGLGLNIARQLCRLNLGELSVESEQGVGSTFSFTIPFAEPREVLRRWLKLQNKTCDWLQLVEITTLEEVSEASEKELDCFLNCLLRCSDLLVRVGRGRWFLVMAVPPSESDRWFERTRQEFVAHNRNRHCGALPDYNPVVLRRWDSSYSIESILPDFEALIERTVGEQTPQLMSS